jgi:hypothetical protein
MLWHKIRRLSSAMSNQMSPLAFSRRSFQPSKKKWLNSPLSAMSFSSGSFHGVSELSKTRRRIEDHIARL